MTSSRSPGTMTRLRGPIRSSMCSGSIAPMATPPMTWSRSGPGCRVSPWTPSRTMASVGLDRIGRYGRTPSSGMPRRARPCSSVRARPGFASRSTLFTIAPATCTPWRSKSAAFSTISSIGRPTPPSDTITAGAPIIAATAAFERPMTAPDARVPRPLDEQDVPVSRERRVGRPDPLAEVLDDPALDVGLGEAARDVDRAHLPERLGEVEDALHEDRVLVGGHAVLDDRPLPDRLDERRSRGRAAGSRRARRG